MSHARVLLEKLAPNLEVEGEMQGDAALSESLRTLAFPASNLKGRQMCLSCQIWMRQIFLTIY